MADITIRLKRLGKKKVREVAYALPPVASFGELIEALVRAEVQRFNDQRLEHSLLPFLTPAEIGEQSQSGKVGFGELANRNLADVDTALEAAKLGFTDGLFVAFLDDEELPSLTTPVALTEQSVLTLIRLTFLTGTYW